MEVGEVGEVGWRAREGRGRDEGGTVRSEKRSKDYSTWFGRRRRERQPKNSTGRTESGELVTQ